MFLEKKTHNNYKKIRKHSCHILKYGTYGIKVSSFGQITETSANSLNCFILKSIKKLRNEKSIKFWNLIFFNLNLTKLSSESRMGKGKGTIFSKAVFFRPGKIIFEFEGLTNQQISLIFFNIKKLSNLKLSLIKK
uniref:50S ribosomal protein L16 n=1 Tax=Mimica arnoldii TaxID=88407 RepID=UPI0027A14314|nr:50S ribosomal protein L16 [Mimica arnoldii]WGO62540.1 50S ribosomal protein L16 [Mimica arnoldii]